MRWNAVVLAGDRTGTDPVAETAQVNCKAEVRIGGQTFFERVISVLAASNSVRQIVAVGPDKSRIKDVASFNAMVAHYGVTHLPVASGLSLSALRGIQHATHYPTLLLPCDLPLLTPTLIDQYCQQMSSVDASVAIGTVDYAHIQNVLPTLKKTTYKLGGRSLCFAGLFSLLTEEGTQAIKFWQTIEASRKKPLEVIRKLGWSNLLRYMFGLITVEQAAQRLSHKTGVRIAIENLAMPEFAIDIDSVMDYQIVQEYIGEQ